MGIPVAKALHFVKTHTRGAEKYRNYAVSDFLTYKGWLSPSDDPDDTHEARTTLEEFQKTWALYKKWVSLCKANPLEWGSANGKQFTKNEMSRKFRYKPGVDWDSEPEVPVKKDEPLANTREAKLDGVGQCEYFAALAFQALKKNGPKGEVPQVNKVSTPGHNWVLVNYSGGVKSQWVVVDYWLLALGVKRDNCICLCSEVGIDFSGLEIKSVDEFNPHKEI